jgi:hypothetical protein
MLALARRQARAIGEHRLQQDDQRAAVTGPVAGLGEGQGHMVVMAAFAATIAGKRMAVSLRQPVRRAAGNRRPPP